MRNPAVDALDVLVGDWELTLTDAWFLESRDVRNHGRATVASDRIEGQWDASEDGGTTWRKDFSVIFERKALGPDG